ncbi:MAG: 30S ribosomal protein S12 methylthiotransferase RimO [Planctomycetota bacterium]|nr:MAG: 30S ribosomal protein S12 methylthiotransferase RimO [Planctomycetota bacterium]
MRARCKKNRLTVAFVALGCPKNIVDSEKMLADIGQAGFIISDDTDNADVVVINTCGFIKPAKDEAFEAIAAAVEQKKRGKVRKVVVAGCLVQRMGAELAKEMDGIDAIAGLGARDDIADIITRSLAQSARQKPAIYLEPSDRRIGDDTGRLLITPGHTPYLRISEGCDRACSFCTIPAIKGRFRSKPAELVLAEAQELVRNGAVEISIIAQDSTYYGTDLGIKNGLSRLVKELDKIEALRWIRLMYLYPAGIDDELIETIAGSKKVVNYIDMPIQHINDDILKAMRRGDRKEKIAELIEKLRRVMPDVVLRTTLIAGFPGESDEQFEELSDFVRTVKFDALGCFGFCAEEGTPAAKMTGQVPQAVKNERLERLMLTQQQIAFEKARGRIGQELVCLIDEVDESGLGRGRFYGQAPKIDSVCYIKSVPPGPSAVAKASIFAKATTDKMAGQKAHPTIRSLKPGEFVGVKVGGSQDYDLLCRAIL